MKKIIAAILVLVISYAGFWFFKSYQIKKEIIVSSSGDGLKYLVGDVAVSGFPLTQKITIKDLKITDEKSGSVTFKNLEVESKVFSSEYVIKVLEPIEISGLKPGEEVFVSLNQDTKILATLDDKKEAVQVKYSGSGYKVLNKERGDIMFSLECKNCDSEVLISDKVNTYKHSDAGSKILDENNAVIATSGSSSFSLAAVKIDDKTASIKFDLSAKDFEHFNLTPLFGKQIAKPQNNPAEAGSGKSNLAIAGEIVVTSNGDKMIDLLPPEIMATIPNESKAKYQKKAAPNSFALKLQNFEFSNALYKIFVNGSLNTYPEDSMPSGSLSLKIENFDNLVKTFTDEMSKFYDQNPGRVKNKNDNLALTEELVSIIKELGVKNSQSKDGSPVFDFKRDKGRKSELTINDVQLLEIMMQFMQLEQQRRQQEIDQIEGNLGAK